MTTVILENISKQIGKNLILQDISLSMRGGTVVGFEGINGSGKTMLMRIIAGLVLPTTGRVLIGGQELHKDLKFPQSMGLLIEAPAFLDGYSGKKNLQLLSSIGAKTTEDELDTLFADVGLCGKENVKYRKYSLGMKQRLGIAAAIMGDPDIILLDEPTNALDAEGVALAKAIIARHRERGALIILSCHDKAFLTETADVVYTLAGGKMVSNET